ncbi:MAG: cytochrome c [Hydrogenobacter thermophilus]|uniref:c-type cytochrome n=1 Tax=Hydrogenobacter thermophilus TaxID=940 RepID=UPI001C75BF30|nr:cytochrome c [Hydrogenobacter thermophilus]QWK19817.1 MAG: cytochrome c [Hydrogenobacter thermophilus]
MRGTIFLGILLIAISFAGEEKVRLKDGEGKALVEANCSVCHSLDYIQMNSPFLDKKGWEAEVNKMIKAFGAPVKQEDVPKIVDYLTKYYGKKD